MGNASVSWRVIDTGCADGATNMAIDEAILEGFTRGWSSPTLRLYQWCPPCVSVGYFQSLATEVRLGWCREMGVEWVRRLTGGRLILHHRELTYSVVAAEDDPLVSGGILESYRKISAGLSEALAELGVAAQLADPAEPGVAAASKAKGGLCFDAAASYELTVDGRKVVGSAQVRRQGAILQHGSILIDVDVPLLYEALNLPHEKTLAEFAAEFESKVVSLRQLLGRTPDASEVAMAVVRGFARAWRVPLAEGKLTPDEQALAHQLRHKYAGDEWNFAR